MQAIRILAAHNILEIQRGKGTFVTQAAFGPKSDLGQLSGIKVTAKDLYEMRLIFEHSHTESGKKDNATPMIDWGKYFVRDNKVILPFSVHVHHSFVDGVHIGKLINILQNYLDNFE